MWKVVKSKTSLAFEMNSTSSCPRSHDGGHSLSRVIILIISLSLSATYALLCSSPSTFVLCTARSVSQVLSVTITHLFYLEGVRQCYHTSALAQSSSSHLPSPP